MVKAELCLKSNTKGHRCFSVKGFSLHANTATNTLARDSLRKLVEYISRGPLSNERLEITKSGQVKHLS
jgi:hypothetical protein